MEIKAVIGKLWHLSQGMFRITSYQAGDKIPSFQLVGGFKTLRYHKERHFLVQILCKVKIDTKC